eukprot:TRINITY_DN10835_c0_g1_i3.p1 TRINITY_DN10835_c0_g1~~TRINITY_DN10835_c0_g1_i3.p1  ORF type:complete len:218 (+),score=24.52 TRINITY_DN10835_c0_g1_i3:101-754(+)
MASADKTSATREVSEIFLKTRKCRYFGMGKCTRGHTCKFAHTSAELRPRMNLTCTKFCPTLLQTGSCADAGCYYAHRRDEVRGRRNKLRRNSERKSPDPSDTCCPSTLPMLFDDTSLPPVADGQMMESIDREAKVSESRGAHMSQAPTMDDVALADSAKSGVSSQVFLHHDLLVIVKNTFIDIERADASRLGGITRSSSAPGSISVERVVKWTMSAQ